MTAFGELLRKYRTRQAWTQGRLAAETGLAKGAIGHYELGTRRPTWDAVQLIAAALGVPVSKFLTDPQHTLRAAPRTKPKPAKKTVNAKVKKKRK